MESVKKRLINFCKGFVIWLLLLFFNTRSGEADANGFKIILDVILAIILVGEYKLGVYSIADSGFDCCANFVDDSSRS